MLAFVCKIYSEDFFATNLIHFSVCCIQLKNIFENKLYTIILADSHLVASSCFTITLSV